MFTINNVNYFDSLTEAKMAILSQLEGLPQLNDLRDLVRISIENHDSKEIFLAKLINHADYAAIPPAIQGHIDCLNRSSFDLTSISDRNMNPLLGAVESFLPNELLLNPTNKMKEVTSKISEVIANTLTSHSNDPSEEYLPQLRNFAKAMIFEDANQYPGAFKLSRINAAITEFNALKANENNQAPQIDENDLRDPSFYLSNQQTKIIVSAVSDNLRSPNFDLTEHMGCHEIYAMVLMKNVPVVLPKPLSAEQLADMATHPDYQTVIQEISKLGKAKTANMNDLHQNVQLRVADPTVRRFISDNMMYESDLYTCESNKGRGKPENVLTNTFGIVRGGNPAFREGLPSTGNYNWVDWTTCEFFQSSKIVASMVEHETPFISSYSGSTSLMMNLMLTSFALPDMNDRQAYIQSVMGYIVGMGFHSQHEIMAPISRCLNLIAPKDYPVELPIHGINHAPQYNHTYQMLAGCDPEFDAKREVSWSKLMDWHNKVYQLHNKSEISAVLKQLIENFPNSKNQATSEAFIINILQHEKLTLDDATISVFMKNGSPEILNNLFAHQSIKPTTKRLSAAIESNNYTAVSQMLATGADISKGNLLLIAVEKGNNQIVELLLKNGAEANVTNEFGFSALYLAYNDNNLPMTKALLENGADLNQVNSEGKTPIIDVLSNDNVNIEILKLLVEHGADLEMRDDFGEGALPIVVAIQSGNIETTKILLNAMSPEQLNAERESLIEEASNAGHEEIVGLLTPKPALSSTSSIAKMLNISLNSPTPPSPSIDQKSTENTTQKSNSTAEAQPEVKEEAKHSPPPTADPTKFRY